MQITPERLAKIGEDYAQLQRSRLRRYREHSGLSQQEVADKLGVSQPAVTKWEREGASEEVLGKLWRLYGRREPYPNAPKDPDRRKEHFELRNRAIQERA